MQKRCFVICPFGKEDSEKRQRSDFIFENYIKKVAKNKGYDVHRSIDKTSPGDIMSQVVKNLYEFELVIADLTGLNPNVFYELALRHSTGKPIIHISENTKNIPFDISGWNVIEIQEDFNIARANKALKELAEQIQIIERCNLSFDNPACRQRGSRLNDLPVGVYRWQISYTAALARQWLQLQENVALREFVGRFDREGGTPEAHLRSGFAEYLAYKMAQGTNLWGDLSYVVESATGNLQGWGNFSLPGSADTLAIKINGWEQQNGSLTINFDQPARKVSFEPGLEAQIRGFSYTVEFIPDAGKRILHGKLYHPDFTEMLLANTTLIPRIV